MISIGDFAKIEIRVGTVLEATDVEESEKLIKLIVDFGEDSPRIVLTGMKTWHEPDYFKDRQLVFVTNLEPRPMIGMESQGMIVAVDGEDGPVLLTVENKVPNGSRVR